MEPKEEQGEINDSPIEQVRLTIPITDDSTLPVLTFRTWVLGPITCIGLAIAHQLFTYRQNMVMLNDTCTQIILLLIGKLMAAKLPTKPVMIPGTNFEFSMNPGPFNIKEHVVLCILATSGSEYPLALTIVDILKAFYHKNISFWASFLLIQTTQMIGYGCAGMFMKFLVNSPYMWWPFSLLNVSFYRALHGTELRVKGHLTKLQFFIIVSVSSFAYYIVPNYFFPSITALSFVCWIWKDSVTAQQLGSGLNGLGIGSFGLDWSAISGFIGNPLVFPRFTVINMLVGFIASLYIIVPIAYWTDSYSTKRFPMYSNALFDSHGQVYNVTRVFGEELKFDQQAYNNYSKIYLSIFFIYGFGFGFASLTATITHFVLFNGRDTWIQFKQALKSQDHFTDVHNRLMKKYETIPQWWFYTMLIFSFGVAIINCQVFGEQIQLPYWGVILGCLLPFILILPLGVLEATTGQGISLMTLSELIMGYAYPGKPIANLAFASYGSSTIGHAIGFISEFKLAHYMKIPPKSMFIAQIVGAFVSYSTHLGTAWWILSSVDNICDKAKLPKGSPWTCVGDHLIYSRSLIWGGVGPSHMFAPYGQYAKMYIFFLIGVIAPLIVWFLSRIFPEKKWIRLITFPIILGVGSNLPLISAVHYWSWFAVAFIFNFLVYSKYKGWWSRHIYDLSNGLDLGVAVMAVLAVYTLQIRDIYGVNWWGLALDDHCPLATCPTAPGIKVEGCPVFD